MTQLCAQPRGVAMDDWAESLRWSGMRCEESHPDGELGKWAFGPARVNSDDFCVTSRSATSRQPGVCQFGRCEMSGGNAVWSQIEANVSCASGYPPKPNVSDLSARAKPQLSGTATQCLHAPLGGMPPPGCSTFITLGFLRRRQGVTSLSLCRLDDEQGIPEA